MFLTPLATLAPGGGGRGVCSVSLGGTCIRLSVGRGTYSVIPMWAPCGKLVGNIRIQRYRNAYIYVVLNTYIVICMHATPRKVVIVFITVDNIILLET